jgi:predicted metal-dependent hydrolase
MNTEMMEINGKKYTVLISLEDRKSSRVSIGKRGIFIKLPKGINRDEMARTILQLKKWAKEHIEKNPPKEPKIKEYKDKDTLIIGNKTYGLSISYAKKQSSSARIKRDEICLIISSKIPEFKQKAHISALLNKVIARQRLPYLKNKVKEINEKNFRLNVNNICFKNQKSRWGSCSKKSNINISTRLIFAPEEVLEYVCIHELAHLIEFNHSERFWSLVEKVMPDYKEKEEWLKKNGDTLNV